MARKNIKDQLDDKLKELYGEKAMLDDDLQTLEHRYAKNISVLSQEDLEDIQTKIDNVKSKITFKQEEIEEVKKDKTDLEESQQEHDTLKWKQIAPLILNSIDELNLSYNVETNKFIYCMDMGENGKFKNPVFRTFEASKIERVIGKHLNKWLFDVNTNIIKLFMVNNKTHYQETASFFNVKWSSDKVYNKASVIRKSWIEPILEQPYHPDFNLLMYCVGGGKAENIEHLEQWLSYKYYWPERVANTPNIDAGGNPGGNGKTLVAELAKTIFTPNCVVPAVAKELMDGFNASWELAIILHFDEPEEKELPASKMKNATGGLEQRVERKGVDSYSSDRNYNVYATSNNPLGIFKLAGTGSAGEDRRYSVITTNIPLVDEIMIRENCDMEQGKIRADEIARRVKDPVEVAKWLGAMLVKHDIPNMKVLPPLHGEDYHARFQDQKTSMDEALDSLMKIAVNEGCIGIKILTDLLTAKVGFKSRPSGRSVSKWVTTWLTKNKVTFTKIDRQRLKIMWKGAVIDNHEQTVFEFKTGANQFNWDSVCSKSYQMATIITADDLLF
jgi:hypothetical protein